MWLVSFEVQSQVGAVSTHCPRNHVAVVLKVRTRRADSHSPGSRKNGAGRLDQTAGAGIFRVGLVSCGRFGGLACPRFPEVCLPE